ncbi:MAG: TIGR00730 family Rossman fold protein [Hyphomicrobiales bacterium]|nr:TIGR00730 family Rossman fold protein [Hyphomicrobiales bacterium]
MAKIESVCVYCGSGNGASPIYAKAAAELGREMAAAGIRLVYGGGSIGLMGTIARTVMAAGGAVTGIIPRFLEERELLLTEISEVIVTADMHERKRLMFERSDAFIALPGGIGTLEELVEMMTWAQLGRHKKPVMIANIDGFWEPLLDLLQHMRDADFIRSEYAINYLVADAVGDILPMLQAAADERSRAELDQDASTGPLSRL